VNDKDKELRRQAEAKAAALPEEPGALAPDKLREAVHDLRVHQIELEMQNEELRRAEAELSAARANYFELYDLAPVGYCVISAKGLIREANLAAAALLGETRAALAAQPLSRFLQPEYADAWHLRYKKLVETGEPLLLEVKLARREGGQPWVRVEGAAARDASGVPCCRLVLADISARKEAERRLVEKTAILAAILECTGLLAFSVDRQYKYLHFNSAHAKAMKQLYGVEIKAGGGLAGYQSVPADWLAARKNLDRALAGESFTEAAFSGEEGPERKYFEVSYNPIRAESAIIGASVSARDTTQRVLLEEKLRQAQKMEAVGLLAGGVAHDFNNILTAIKVYGVMVKKSLPAGVQAGEDIQEILAAADRAESLTHQLLAFSRRQILAPRVVDLNRVLGDLQKMLRRIIGEEVKLTTGFFPAPCEVMADPGQVGQAVMNLVINARDAALPGGQISLETEILTPPAGFFTERPGLARGPVVAVRVRDNGRGMDAEATKRIFEPFYTTKDKSKGTGLGLSMVYGIMKQSGGDIEVESLPGAGSVFTLYFPKAEAAPSDSCAAKTGAPLRSGSETILLVDDDEMLRRMGERLLSSSGYTVVSAAGGAEALAAAAPYGRPFDLLVTDVVMPGMNGRELARELTARKLVLKTLYMSGYTDDAIVKHGVLEPGIAFIYKPFSIEGFSAKLREVLDGPETDCKA